MRTSLCVALLLVAPAFSLAQTRPPTVTVTAQGTFKAAPDTAVVSMEVSGQSPDLKDAYARAQSQADAVRLLLRQQGFTPAEAHWSGLQVQPNVDYKTNQVTSYTVRNDLQLKLTDFARIGPLLNAATGKGLNALRNISFELAHPDKAKADAIADGFAKAHAEAAALARAAGVTLAGLESVTVDTSGGLPHPMPRFAAMAVDGAPAPTAEFTPQAITVTATITAIFRLGH